MPWKMETRTKPDLWSNSWWFYLDPNPDGPRMINMEAEINIIKGPSAFWLWLRGRLIALSIPTDSTVSHGFKVVQDLVHPQQVQFIGPLTSKIPASSTRIPDCRTARGKPQRSKCLGVASPADRAAGVGQKDFQRHRAKVQD